MEGTILGPEILTEVQTNFTGQMSISNTDIFRVCVYVVIFVTGVIGNGLVIFVTGYRMKTTVNSIWFLNLAIADLIFMPILVYNTVDVFHSGVSVSNIMYKCGYFILVLNMFASVFFLMVISLDRCLCTWVVVWAQNKRTLVKARIICVFVWILSLCCSILYIIVLYKHDPKDAFIYEYESFIIARMSLYTCRFIVGFLVPFLIIASSYIAIGVRVKRLRRGKQLLSLRLIISVILAFFICWLPYHVLQFCYISSIKNHWSASVREGIETARPFLICLVYLNSCLNPILYVFMCDEYKKKLKRSLLLVLEAAFTEENLGLQPTPSVHTT